MYAVADAGFPGAQLARRVRQPTILQNFCQKLHETIFYREGARIPGAPLDPPLVSE